MFLFAYGVGAYVLFLLTLLYSIGFVENWIVSLTLDGARAGATGGVADWLGNTVLFGLFAAVHLFMGRPVFRQAWAQILPPAAERSTRVLVSSLSLMVVFGRWTPIPQEVFNAGIGLFAFLLEMLSYAGWALALAGTFQLDHLELFGLRQVFSHARGEEPPPPEFRIPYLYRWVRHPIYLGILVAVWATPRMTLGHLLFAVLVTVYVRFVARLEEDELARKHVEYRRYQAFVPMLLPGRRPRQLRKRAG